MTQPDKEARLRSAIHAVEVATSRDMASLRVQKSDETLRAIEAAVAIAMEPGEVVQGKTIHFPDGFNGHTPSMLDNLCTVCGRHYKWFIHVPCVASSPPPASAELVAAAQVLRQLSGEMLDAADMGILDRFDRNELSMALERFDAEKAKGGAT